MIKPRKKKRYTAEGVEIGDMQDAEATLKEYRRLVAESRKPLPKIEWWSRKRSEDKDR